MGLNVGLDFQDEVSSPFDSMCGWVGKLRLDFTLGVELMQVLGGGSAVIVQYGLCVDR